MLLYGEKLPEAGSLAERLIQLDQFLTQQPLHRCIHTHRDQGDNGDEGIYYLSDGGYSRLVIGWLQREGGRSIRLTSNSLPSVKHRWPLAIGFITAVEKALERAENEREAERVLAIHARRKEREK